MKGYSLLEFTITLSIILLLLLFAVPAYHDLRQHYQADVAINYLHRGIYFARAEAIQRRQMVKISPDGAWQQGMIVSSNHVVIKHFAGISGKGKITWRGFPNYDYLQFTPQGFTYYQNGTFSYISAENKVIKKLIINQAGRIRTESV
ncbi:MAG: GspH/FimT family protein [Pseudomonadota bacterium]